MLMIFVPGWERFSPHALQLFEHRMTAASAGTNRQRLPKTHYGAAPDPAAQFRLREVLEDELGLEDAPEIPICAVETVLGAEAYQSFQGH